MLVQLWNAAYPGMEVPCAYRDSEAGSVFASTWCSLGFTVSACVTLGLNVHH